MPRKGCTVAPGMVIRAGPQTTLQNLLLRTNSLPQGKIETHLHRSFNYCLDEPFGGAFGTPPHVT